MSLVPEFELGLWNAWIIAVLGFILSMIPFYINKEVVEKRGGRTLSGVTLAKPTRW